jgi:phosphomannomutase
MAEQLIVSVSGIRGTVGATLTPDVAMTLAQALGTHLLGQPVVLSRDSRPSGMMLHAAAAAGLMSVGCTVHDLGIAPTPTVGVAIRHLQAAGGIQITASHNPSPYNGLKLFGGEGQVLPPSEGERVLCLYRERLFSLANWEKAGIIKPAPNEGPYHVVQVLRLVSGPRIRHCNFRVLLDANGGAGGQLARRFLEQLGCQVVPIGCTPNGHFAHEPEPTAENLRDIAPMVVTHQCHLGLALDPDADRLALIDEKGRYIGEEMTLALAVLRRLREQQGPVVVNMSTSRLTADIAARHNSPCLRSPVGEAHVVARMQQENAVIGGEGNGGVIDPRIGWVRDPWIATGLILELLATEQKPLSAVVADLPQYVIRKDKYTVPPERLPSLYDQITQRWTDAEVNRADGLRLDWRNSWLHVRPSNTEPIIRVIAEAPTEEEAVQLCKEVGTMLREGATS